MHDFLRGRQRPTEYHRRESAIVFGRPCTATALSVADTSNQVNEDTVYEVELTVRPVDGAGRTEFRCVIGRDDASRVEAFWTD